MKLREGTLRPNQSDTRRTKNKPTPGIQGENQGGSLGQATLGDVKDCIATFWGNCELFGVESEVRDQFRGCCRAVGISIINESGLSQEEAKRLPDSHVLDEKSAELFREMKRFADEAGPADPEAVEIGGQKV